jgi:hypothetical protein
MKTCGIIKIVTHHTPRDLCCLHIHLDATFSQHKKNHLNIIHNDMELKTFDSWSIMSTIASKVFRSTFLINNILDLQHFL